LFAYKIVKMMNVLPSTLVDPLSTVSIFIRTWQVEWFAYDFALEAVYSSARLMSEEAG
jgi:hypothetical protein